jgi:TolB-like protein/Tfp pilus assembly protein PilF
MAHEPVVVFEFGPFRLEPAERQLRRDGRLVPLTPKAFDTLHVLAERGGRAISKDDLIAGVWPDTNVSDATLAQNILAVRRALGDAESIETIAKFGYRLTLPVRRQQAALKVTLAVLPFEDLSGDAGQEYFSDGLTDEMIGQLSRLNPERLGVIARTSSMKYKRTSKTIAEIGKELGVTHVVEGSVRRAGGRVRVTARLIQVADQTQVWSESYDRGFDDMLALQGELAQAIAREIRIKITPREAQRLAAAGAIGARAHEAYLKGRYFWNKRTEDAFATGIQHFHDAIAHEPNYAAAYDGLADSYTMLACRGVLPVAATFERARAAALKALDIDPLLGEGHASLAHVRLHDWDWTGLDEAFRRALELNPAHAIAYYWYAEYLMVMGRVDESIEMVRAAQRMDPLSAVLNASLGMILYLARRYDESIDCLRRALETDAGHFLLHFRLGLGYMQNGRPHDAVDEMKQAMALSRRSTEALAGLAQAYAAAGLTAEMQQALGEVEEQGAHRYVSPYNVSRAYAAARDVEATFAWLERAFEEHNPDLIELRAEPVFDAVRPDPRFGDLLRRVGWRT